MRRYHLIELHEQPWFPASWRRLFQSGIGQAIRTLGALDEVAESFERFLDRICPSTVLDLCSGSGEAVVSLWKRITPKSSPAERPRLTLSDLYPHEPAYAALKASHPGLVDFYPEPVDALDPPADAPRVRTMFDSLHHFRPDQVREILRKASESADGFAAFEITGRTWKNMLMTVFCLPFGAAFITAFLVRPVRPRNLIWGLLLPVIPLVAVFDGLVSNLRTYTVEELEEITRSIASPDFSWEIGTARIPGTPLRSTYIYGWRNHR